jgi:Family of unknown function (DUF6941)
LSEILLPNGGFQQRGHLAYSGANKSETVFLTVEVTMNIEVLALCDAATDQQGKLNLLGAFDGIFARQVPVVHPQCSVALRTRFHRNESGTHRTQISIVDHDGKPIMQSLDANITVQIDKYAESAVTNLVMNIQQLKFERFGDYSVNVVIDGKKQGSIPLSVRQAPGSV